LGVELQGEPAKSNHILVLCEDHYVTAERMSDCEYAHLVRGMHAPTVNSFQVQKVAAIACWLTELTQK